MWFSAPQIKIEIELALGDGESHTCHFRSVWFCLQCRMQQIPCVAVQRWREVRCSSRVQSESQKRSTPLEDLVWATPDHAGLLREIREQSKWLLLCWKKKTFFLHDRRCLTLCLFSIQRPFSCGFKVSLIPPVPAEQLCTIKKNLTISPENNGFSLMFAENGLV